MPWGQEEGHQDHAPTLAATVRFQLARASASSQTRAHLCCHLIIDERLILPESLIEGSFPVGRRQA